MLLYQIYTHENYEQTANAPAHFAKLNNIALKYCNKAYVKGGVCNSTTVRPMNATDFKKITGKTLSSSSCYSIYGSMPCGYDNDLIDNGGFYWIATLLYSGDTGTLYWNSEDRKTYSPTYTNRINGVRPVIALDSLVRVVEGDGSYEYPFVITLNEV